MIDYNSVISDLRLLVNSCGLYFSNPDLINKDFNPYFRSVFNVLYKRAVKRGLINEGVDSYSLGLFLDSTLSLSERLLNNKEFDKLDVLLGLSKEFNKPFN